ncbi:MAG: TIGR03619 family F420-dependent LLM class oxidoreductase [Acidimicrobiales bacterium]
MVTTRLRTATSVLILPERPALLTAKEVMTLDHISGGRFDLGVGIGWSDEEYAALGIPWERRGKRADEYIEAIRAAWANDIAAYHGEFVNFDNAVLRPAPTKGSVPIIVGGDSPAAMRRAARHGDGWYGWWAGVELEAHLDKLRAIMAAEGCEQGPNWSLRVGLPIGHETPTRWRPWRRRPRRWAWTSSWWAPASPRGLRPAPAPLGRGGRHGALSCSAGRLHTARYGTGPVGLSSAARSRWG